MYGGNNYKTHSSELQILQNQVVYIITGSKLRCHVDPQHKHLVHTRNAHVEYMYDQNVPPVFGDLFTFLTKLVRLGSHTIS